ncbi:UDP-N-acetylmuramate dehydrogenase [Humibacter ginsenosidimutans]|uniref:UDP-N-acetylenolpyruvoylglucosamine reductase n=1 Tax=Humibacter ginsenosidimutans TaxID=2599293 RepID=A0A5B8M9U3_9MICO|nr:UDP-N-acetylmuramate dehydrogenase [Humibacter ginsenosidimutans]QDZ16961.1 UDP-N-acetylmuramate dehydrogenase [Humibacter ginsenosidimutans]
MRVGGPAERLVTATTEDELIAIATSCYSEGEPVLLLGGGSNTIVSDDGFDGTTIRIATRGVEQLPSESGERDAVRLRVQAGESWDGLVALAVRNRWAGIEALSGIPGSVGAAPVQNIGAYGQELSSVLVAVDFVDAVTGELRHLTAADLGLGYRTSVLKRGLEGVVTAVELELTQRPDVGAALSEPVAYAQLANALAVDVGTQVSLGEVRRTVLRLRASKGMVLDPDDPDSVSAGSFFTNPIVSARFARTLPDDAPRWPLAEEEPALVAALDGATAEESVAVGMLAEAAGDRERRRSHAESPQGPGVKLSAAWLIEHSGISRGFALPGSKAAISSKHTLAITNRGGASALEIVQLATFVQSRVQSEFGVLLRPEPVLVGIEL